MTEIVTATVTGDGPLQGAELRIECLRDWAEVYVHLDAIGTHAARWVPLQDVDRILADLAHEDEARPLGADLRTALETPHDWKALGYGDQADMDADLTLADTDPLAEVARSHDDRAAARTERRLHDAG